MAQVIKLKRSSVAGKAPSTSDLQLGEIAVNTADGKIYFEKNDGSPSVQTILTTDSQTTGSIEITGNISGSLVSTGSFGHIMVGGGNFTSASLAGGGSGTGFPFTGSAGLSGSMDIIGSGSNIFTVDGTNGRLFSVSDEISGSVFRANLVSGLPVIEAFSDNIVKIGAYADPIIISGSGMISGSSASTASFGHYANISASVAAAGFGSGGGGGAVSAVANGVNNRIATFSSADALNGEANLTFDGNNLTLGDGNVIFASGHGLDFAATANAPENSPTTNSELFHDYEEGTWTPFLAGVSSAGSGTYADTWGSYTRIGRVVFASFRLYQSAHTGSGGMRLDGIPFTAVTASGTATSTSNGNHTVGSIDGESLSLTKNKISAQLENANTRFRIMQSDGDMAWVNIEDGQVWLNGTIWYETN